MIKLIFENSEVAMIQDRFIKNLEIRGAVDEYKQVGARKHWAKSAESVLLEFKPNEEIITEGLHEEKDLVKRLDKFSDISIIEVDGQTYYVPYKGCEINLYQNMERLDNGDIRIIINKK